MGGEYHPLSQLSKETSQMFKDIASTMTKLQEQTDSLAALALQNKGLGSSHSSPMGNLSAPPGGMILVW